jgi:ABC-type branched-subunit amino acid transport system substrate-binding protein
LLAAIEQAGTFEPTAAAKALEQGTFNGIAGKIKFDRNHDPTKPVTVIKIENEQKTVLQP